MITSLLCDNGTTTHSVPHHNVNIIAKGAIDVLRGIQVEEITVMVVQVDTCEELSTCFYPSENTFNTHTHTHSHDNATHLHPV